MNIKNTTHQQGMELIQSGARAFRKNITFFKADPAPEGYMMAREIAGTPGATAWTMMQMHHKEGVQMQVSKEVSDDLLESDFSAAAKVENVPFPAPSVEFYFEDPKLPTIIAARYSPEFARKTLPGCPFEMTAPEYMGGMIQEGGEMGSYMTVMLRPEMYDDFLKFGVVEQMAEKGPLSTDLSRGDNAVISVMLQLALKVMAFASVPAFRPLPIGRKGMHHGGKSGVKGRPERPAVRVWYAPKVRSEHASGGRGKPKAASFHGRRGHIRWFSSEVFRLKRGTWTFIAPVPDPETGKIPKRGVIIKVRKPKV
jgi:hypothetical protein